MGEQRLLFLGESSSECRADIFAHADGYAHIIRHNRGSLEGHQATKRGNEVKLANDYYESGKAGLGFSVRTYCRVVVAHLHALHQARSPATAIIYASTKREQKFPPPPFPHRGEANPALMSVHKGRPRGKNWAHLESSSLPPSSGE